MSRYTNKIRIIIFLPNFGVGGASESLIKLIKFLSKKKFSLLVISIGNNSYKKKIKKFGCEVVEIYCLKTFFAIFKIRSLLSAELDKKYKKTVFISNIHYANIVSVISSFNLKNIKTILTERSSLSELHVNNGLLKTFKNKIIFYLSKIFYRYSDLIITNSKFEQIYIKKKIKINKIITIHPPSINKIILPKFKNNYKKTLRIIYVGRLSKEKGVLTILRALQKIKDKKNFFLKIYGEGPEKNKIIDLIKKYDLQKKVNLHGYEKNKDEIFMNADVFINASLFEGLPNALVQALNYNLQIICSRSPGGNKEVIKNGKYGLMFNVNDENDLAKKIMKLKLNHNIKNKNQKINHLLKFTKNYSNNQYFKLLSEI